MKTIPLILLAVFATVAAPGQGAIDLPPVPITNALTGALGDSHVMAQLFVGTFGAPESSLAPVAGPLSLANGYASFGAVVVAYPADSLVELQIRAWDDTSGLYVNWSQAQPAWQAGLISAGRSSLVNALAQSQQEPPVQLTFPGFAINHVPEPSPGVMGLLAATGWFVWRTVMSRESRAVAGRRRG